MFPKATTCLRLLTRGQSSNTKMSAYRFTLRKHLRELLTLMHGLFIFWILYKRWSRWKIKSKLYMTVYDSKNECISRIFIVAIFNSSVAQSYQYFTVSVSIICRKSIRAIFTSFFGQTLYTYNSWNWIWWSGKPFLATIRIDELIVIINIIIIQNTLSFLGL